MTKDEELKLKLRRLIPVDPASRSEISAIDERIARLESAKETRALALDEQIEKLKQLKAQKEATMRKRVVVKAPKQGDE
jgi:hypothetical protein